MAEEKRYYWLKFKEDFFTSKRIKKLRKISADCVIIYLKMQLKALKTNGYLEFTGIEDSIADEIALDIDEDSDKVQLTLSFLQACGLVELSTDMIFLPYVQESTGSETASALRGKEYRASLTDEQREKERERARLGMQKSRANKKSVTNELRTSYEQVTNVEIDIEKDIDIDIDIEKEKEKDTELEKNTISAKASKNPPKHKHGEYQHVLLTDDELNRLFDDYGESDVEAGIKYLDEYIEMKGAKYKNHNLVLRKWGIDGAKKKKPDTESDFERKWRSALDD